MFPSFLPASVERLTEPASIDVLKAIQRESIVTPLSSQPISTAYLQQGSGGTPILLLHGFDSSLLEFRLILPLLAEQTETWSVDLLGFGFTDRPAKLPYTPAAIKAHLYQFWKTLIDRPIILVGASMGGATAIDFTLTYPDIVERLVLIDSLGYTSSPAFVQYLFPPFDVLAVEYLRQRKVAALEICRLINADASLIDLLHCSVLHTEMPGWTEATIAFTKSGGVDQKR